MIALQTTQSVHTIPRERSVLMKTRSRSSSEGLCFVTIGDLEFSMVFPLLLCVDAIARGSLSAGLPALGATSFRSELEILGCNVTTSLIFTFNFCLGNSA